jgi:uncharacterized protein (DUF3084 family)
MKGDHMENMMPRPTLTPYDIEAEKFLAQRLADRCAMALSINAEAGRALQQVETQSQQIDVLAKQIEEQTKTIAARDEQIAKLTDELTALRCGQPVIEPAAEEPDAASGD